MDIRFTSTLTPEDENVLAPAVLKVLTGIFDLLPIAYLIRIDTVDAHVYQHRGPAGDAMASIDAELPLMAVKSASET